MSEAAPSAAPAAAAPNGASPKSTVAPVAPPAGGIETKPNAPTPAEKRSYKLKVDETEVPWEGTDADVQRELQISHAARKRLKEAAEEKAAAKREREEWKAKVKADPWAALQAEGLDPDELLATRLASTIQAQTMTAEQRALAEAQAKLKALEEEKLTRAQAEEKAKADAAADATWAQLEPQFLAAVQKYPELPVTKGTMKKVAALALKFIEAGVDLSPEQVVAELARTEGETLHGRIRSAPLGVLKAWLTTEQRYAIARDVSEELKAKRNGGAPAAANDAPPPRPAAPAGKSMTQAEFLRAMKNR